MRSSVKVTALPFFFDISFYDIILLLLLLVAVVVDLSSFSLLTTTTDNPPVDDWVKRLMKIMTHLESSGVGRCHRHLQIANVWQRCSPHSQCRLRCHFFFFFFFFFFMYFKWFDQIVSRWWAVLQPCWWFLLAQSANFRGLATWANRFFFRSCRLHLAIGTFSGGWRRLATFDFAISSRIPGEFRKFWQRRTGMETLEHS